MQLAEPVVSSWKAQLSLGFSFLENRTVLSERKHDGPLVVQKPLYPEGAGTCHAIVVHPPGGIAGGDELSLDVRAGKDAAALLTTPGAAKWYRSAGPRARQDVALDVQGRVEWLPQEAIVFDGARAETALEADLAAGATDRAPRSHSTSPAAILSKVDLPEPLRPTRHNRSPSPSINSAPESSGAPPKVR